MRTKSFEMVVDQEHDGGELVAYASTFDREPDTAGDVVRRGAFAETLAEWKESGAFIPLLFGHRMDDPRMNLGRVVAAEEDDRGLLIRAEFDSDNEIAQYVRKLVCEGRLAKMSFAYDVLDEAPIVLPDGRKANELRKLKLHEVSLVPVPANSHADVLDVKSSLAGDTLEKDEIEDVDSAENADELDVAPLAVSAKADGEEEVVPTPDEGGADARDSERLASMVVALAERLDQLTDGIDAITERMVALAEEVLLRLPEPAGEAESDVEAKADEAAETDTDDNREADKTGNREINEKATRTLSAMARYINID